LARTLHGCEISQLLPGRVLDIELLMSPTSTPPDLFVSYAASDEVHKDKLAMHLAVLKRQGKILVWDSLRTGVNDGQGPDVATKVETANVIILLVSAEYLASDEKWHEMERAVARHHAREAYVLPVIVSACDWRSTPFARLQTLPSNCKTILDSPVQDEEWASVVRGVRRFIEGNGRATFRVE
jgi:hypothetical protein